MKNNHNNIGIVELIDRTLNKGIMLNADLVITVADVPLLAANLRLALASVETMLKYGMMNDLLKPKPLITELKPGLLIKEESKKEIDIGMKEVEIKIRESHPPVTTLKPSLLI